MSQDSASESLYYLPMFRASKQALENIIKSAGVVEIISSIPLVMSQLVIQVVKNQASRSMTNKCCDEAVEWMRHTRKCRMEVLKTCDALASHLSHHLIHLGGAFVPHCSHQVAALQSKMVWYPNSTNRNEIW